mgnify:CR=1 FL=1
MRKIVDTINWVYDKLMSLGVSIIVEKRALSKIISKSGKNKHCKGITQWKGKWKVLGHVNKDYYRIFSQYIGEDVNIVPDDICHNVIEPILNPKRFISAYEDKCLFDKMLWSSFNKNVTPTTYIRNIGGAYFDNNYHHITQVDSCINTIPVSVNRLIIKKSIDSSSGRGIIFCNRDKDGIFRDSSNNAELSEQYLTQIFIKDFVIQEVMSQSSFMSQFCKTSVNTIRIAVYRSVNTNKPIVINAIMRIGKDGSLVDNAHAGGMFVGINQDGELGKYCCNQYGIRTAIFNDINFSSEVFTIPNYEHIKAFAEKVASALPHQRLLALDIMLDANNSPVLLEYNIRGFSVWLFQFTTRAGFGEYTDEIIEYCTQHRKEATRVSVLF